MNIMTGMLMAATAGVAVALQAGTTQRGEQWAIPASIVAEHREVREELTHATMERGEVGVAARALAAVLNPHFIREEQIALPPLAALEPLASGAPVGTLLNLLPLSDSLRAELPDMLREHEVIKQALERLVAVAERENRSDIQAFAERLALHALSEEEITYPAAVLAGELIRSRAREGKGGVPCSVSGAALLRAQ